MKKNWRYAKCYFKKVKKKIFDKPLFIRAKPVQMKRQG